jgi:hypothetical protein
MDALATPRFIGINIEHAVTTALQGAAAAGFAESQAIDEEAALPVVHDEFRIALAGPVDAILIAASRAINVGAAARFRDALLAAFLFAFGTALLLVLLLLVLGGRTLAAEPGEHAPQRQTEHDAAGAAGGQRRREPIEGSRIHARLLTHTRAALHLIA